MSEIAKSPQHEGLDRVAEYERSGSLDALNRGIERLDKAAALIPVTSPELAPCLRALGNALRLRFAETHIDGDLGRSLEVLGAAVATSQRSSDHAFYLDDLATTRAVLYLQSAERTQIDSAILARETAVMKCRRSGADRARILHNLGMDYLHRFNGERDARDLDRAIAAFGRAVETALRDHPETIQHVLSLADGFAARYGLAGALEDLDAAVSHRAMAISQAPGSYPRLIQEYSKLGTELMELYTRRDDPLILERAVSIWDTAAKIAKAVDPGNVPRILNNVAAGIMMRYTRTSDVADLDDAVTTLDEALVALDAAVRIVPGDAADRPKYREALARALTERFRRTGEADDLRRASALRKPAARD